MLSWNPLPIGFFKLNFDGASKGNLDKARFGCEIRDHEQNVMWAMCRPLGIYDATKVKTTSLLMRLRKLNHQGLKDYEVKGDSVVVTS